MKRILLLILCAVLLVGCEKVKSPFNTTDRKPKIETLDSLFVITQYSNMGSVIKTYIGKGKIETEYNGQVLVFKDKDSKQHRISGGITDIEYGN